jgi:hypothetical protein
MTQHLPLHNNGERTTRTMAATTTSASPTTTASNEDGNIGEREQAQQWRDDGHEQRPRSRK